MIRFSTRQINTLIDAIRNYKTYLDYWKKNMSITSKVNLDNSINYLNGVNDALSINTVDDIENPDITWVYPMEINSRDKNGNRIAVIGISTQHREVVYQCELENKENWKILEEDMDTYQHLYAERF